MSNAVYGKTRENLRNRIDLRLVSNKKDYLKRTSTKIFDNDLEAIHNGKVALQLNNPAYVRMCILNLGKVLM